MIEASGGLGPRLRLTRHTHPLAVTMNNRQNECDNFKEQEQNHTY